MTLVHYTSPVLRTPAVHVSDIAREVMPYVDDLRKVMERNHGLGLAAPQVGIGYRFFVTQYKPIALVINPVIVERAGANVSKIEGCLSFPKRQTYVKRAERVLLQWTNGAGERSESWFSGIEARVIQHETDHLDGICIF